VAAAAEDINRQNTARQVRSAGNRCEVLCAPDLVRAERPMRDYCAGPANPSTSAVQINGGAIVTSGCTSLTTRFMPTMAVSSTVQTSNTFVRPNADIARSPLAPSANSNRNAPKRGLGRRLARKLGRQSHSLCTRHSSRMLLRAPGRGNNKATLPDLKNGCTGHAGATIKRRLHEVASIAGRYECTGAVGLGMFDNEHRDGGHT